MLDSHSIKGLNEKANRAKPLLLYVNVIFIRRVERENTQVVIFFKKKKRIKRVVSSVQRDKRLTAVEEESEGT